MSDAHTPLYLALDQGGSQSRALVIDATGAIVLQTAVAVATQRPRPLWVEQQPHEVSDSVRRAAEQAIKQLSPAQRDRLQACGLACQRSSLLAWDRQRNQALSPLLSWQDTRAAQRMPSSASEIATLRRITGLYPSAHHGASKFAWLLEQAPIRAAAIAQTLQLQPLATFLAQQLFGHYGLDPANAQRTLLWDRHQQSWSPALLQRFGITANLLPPLQSSLGDWGELQLASLQLPCRLMAGDQSVAPLANGALASDTVSINLGTGAFLCTPDHDYPADRLLHSLAYSDGKHSLGWLEGTVNGAGAALQWLAAQPSTAQPNRITERRPPLFLNAVGGLGSPYWRADLHSRFIDTPPESRQQAVLESVLFLLQENLNEMVAAGVPLRCLRLSGGLSQHAGLAQQLASLSGLPVELQPEVEATARGLVWVLAGQPSDWQCGTTQRFLPQPDPWLLERQQQWQQAMATWLSQPAG